MKIIKVDNKWMTVESVDTQFTIGSHGTISIKVDTHKNPDYYSYFTKLYDSQNKKINLEFSKYKAKGCFIKMIDIDTMACSLNLSLNCDYIQEIDLQEMRDIIIDEVLQDETSQEKNNINKNLNN